MTLVHFTNLNAGYCAAVNILALTVCYNRSSAGRRPLDSWGPSYRCNDRSKQFIIMIVIIEHICQKFDFTARQLLVAVPFQFMHAESQECQI